MKATYHCETVKLEVTFSQGLESARHCDCSFCGKRGAIAVLAPLNGV